MWARMLLCFLKYAHPTSLKNDRIPFKDLCTRVEVLLEQINSLYWEEAATISEPMWYTSVSGLRNSFFGPPNMMTCSHILVYDSSASHVNCLSHWGAYVRVTNIAWFLRVPSSPAVTNHWFGWSFHPILLRKNLERKQTRLRLLFLQDVVGLEGAVQNILDFVLGILDHENVGALHLNHS